MVRMVPSPSCSTAPPSSTKSNLRTGVPASRAMSSPTVASSGRSNLPPQPLVLNRSAIGAALGCGRRSGRYRAARYRRNAPARSRPRRRAAARAEASASAPATSSAHAVRRAERAHQRRHLAARAREIAVPLVGIGRPGGPDRLLRRPFGRNGNRPRLTADSREFFQQVSQAAGLARNRQRFSSLSRAVNAALSTMHATRSRRRAASVRIGVLAAGSPGTTMRSGVEQARACRRRRSPACGYRRRYPCRR